MTDYLELNVETIGATFRNQASGFPTSPASYSMTIFAVACSKSLWTTITRRRSWKTSSRPNIRRRS